MKKIYQHLLLLIIVFFILLQITLITNMFASASFFKKLKSNIDVNWSEEETEKPLVPRNEIRSLNLTVSYNIDWGGDYSYGLFVGYVGQNKKALINMKVTESSEWCVANLKQARVGAPILENRSETTAVLNIILLDDAPAYGEGYVKIEASIPDTALIDSFSKEFTLNFDAGYYPTIDIQLPESNSKQIDPTESAVFPIEIENLGNARTQVLFEILNVPKGWTIAITDNVVLNEMEGSTATAYLTINPPQNTGYHYDEQNIEVKIIPVRADNPLDQGDPLYQTFLVQSRGFSTPGFESIIFICAFLIVLFIFYLKKK